MKAQITKTSEIEMAEEAALTGVNKLRAIIQGRSNDFKGAKAAQRDLNRYLRLQRQRCVTARDRGTP